MGWSEQKERMNFEEVWMGKGVDPVTFYNLIMPSISKQPFRLVLLICVDRERPNSFL